MCRHAGTGKRSPDPGHRRGQPQRIRAQIGQMRQVQRVERERHIHRVRRLEPTAMHRRFPIERIHPHRRPVLGHPPLRQRQRPDAEIAVGRRRDQPFGRARPRIQARIGFQNAVRVLAGQGRDAGAQFVLGQGAMPDLVVGGHEDRGLVLHVANDQRDIGGNVRRVRIEGMARHDIAIHHRPERIAIHQRSRRRAQRLLRRIDRPQQSRDRQGLQSPNVARRQPELLQYRIRQLRRPLLGAQANTGPALDDRAMEQASRRRHGEQDADLPTTTGFPEDRDIVGIAPERGGVIAHPFQRRDHVQRAGIPRPSEFRRRDRRQIQMTEDVQALVDIDHDDIAAPRQTTALQPSLVSVAIRERTAMEPHHDRPLRSVRGRCPDVDGQAVLGFRRRIGHAGQCFQLRPGRGTQTGLRGLAGIVQRIPHPAPSGRRHWRHETIGTRGRRAIRHGLERKHAVDDRAAHPSRRGFHHRRPDRRTASHYPLWRKIVWHSFLLVAGKHAAVAAACRYPGGGD